MFHGVLISDCYVDNGVTYRGSVAWTDKRTQCIHWALSNRHTHANYPNSVCSAFLSFSLESFNNNGLVLAILYWSYSAILAILYWSHSAIP